MEIFQSTESKAKQKTENKKKKTKHIDKVMFPCGGGRFASLRGNQPPKEKKKRILNLSQYYNYKTWLCESAKLQSTILFL